MQFWVKLQKIGSDITAVANNLSEKTRAAYQEQVGESSCRVPNDVMVKSINLSASLLSVQTLQLHF